MSEKELPKRRTPWATWPPTGYGPGELLACPWPTCGSERVRWTASNGEAEIVIYCADCSTTKTTRYRWDRDTLLTLKEEAFADWNRRPEAPSTREQILALITGKEGYAVTLFGGLIYLCRLESGQYSVTEDAFNSMKAKERLFNGPGEAVDDFLATRDRRQCGYDFEVSRPDES
jgi:hypothetical protein